MPDGQSDSLAYSRGFGTRNVEIGRFVTPRTRFCVASTAKPFVGVLAAVPGERDSIGSAIAAMAALTEPGQASHLSRTYGQAFADWDIAATPVEERLRSFIDAFNQLAPDRWAQAERLVESHYADSALTDQAARRQTEFFLRQRDNSGGLAVETVDASAPTTATIHLTEQGVWGGRWTFRMEVQSEAPHKITAFDPVSLPDYSSSLEHGDGEETSTSLSETEIVRRARETLDRAEEEGTLSGAVLIGRNGRPLLVEAYGLANRTYNVPNRVETKFSIASVGKMFTAVAIAQLVSEEKVALDDKLAEHVPDLPTPEAAQKIEIRHLLSHTSGMGPYLREYQKNRDKSPIEFIRGDSLQFEPGSGTQYSNSGFIALGKVIEAVADTTYAGYLDEHVFGPAGMIGTYVRRPGNVHPAVATGYEKRYTETGTGFRRMNIGGSDGAPDGGAESTVMDLLRFATALQQGVLVDPAILRTFTSAKPELGQDGYGYGFQVYEDGTVYGHTGGFPGVSAGVDIYRQSGFVVVVLANQSRALIRRRVSGTLQSLIQRVR